MFRFACFVGAAWLLRVGDVLLIAGFTAPVRVLNGTGGRVRTRPAGPGGGARDREDSGDTRWCRSVCGGSVWLRRIRSRHRPGRPGATRPEARRRTHGTPTSPGGSSAGSAAAVTARIPVAWCQILGYRPTNGLLPPRDRAGLNVGGPLARHAADVLAYAHTVLGLVPARRPAGGRRLRAASSPALGHAATCPEVAATAAGAIRDPPLPRGRLGCPARR